MIDLLGREPVKISLKSSLNYLRGKRVLITGAGGSIGKELCRQLLFGGAQRLYLFDHSENNIYEIEKELKQLQENGYGEKATIVSIVGELQDEHYINFLLSRLKTDVIFHTAAYKHVPLMEQNPVEVFKNNLMGTKFLVEAAQKTNTSRFVFISTDKAVEPSSIYGVSKLLCEQVVLNAAKKSNLDFMVVRFGNVLGSTGSIVPLFVEQIKNGGPLTITDEGIDRFFMSIEEASSLVLKTGGTGLPGELYILDMGEPVKIVDLAKKLIDLYGEGKKIDIKFIGLRAGEKLHERLWEENQKIEPTGEPKLNKLLNPIMQNLDIDNLVEEIKPICFYDSAFPKLYRNKFSLKEILSQFFPFLTPSKTESIY